MQTPVATDLNAIDKQTYTGKTPGETDRLLSSPGQAIRVSNVSKSWDGTKAVDDVSIDVPAGTFTVLLGPSGCGKSTTLRIIAGLEYADSGTVRIGSADVTDTPPVKRNLAMVFQSYALFPHLNVAENILFGLKVRRVHRKEQRERLNKTATMLGLGDYLKRRPAQLSGGQQQRVALGRAIIAEKPVCLMDEPLSNLDAKLRNSMRTEIRELQQKLGFSMVYVTHDQAEAITMADQVVVMREGRVEQAGSPRQIYERPATSFVAGFIGTPPMNLIDCARLIDCTGQQENYTLGVRPENIRIGDTGVEADVTHVEYMGADLLVDCSLVNGALVNGGLVNNGNVAHGIVDNSTAQQASGNCESQTCLQVRASGTHQIQPGERVRLQWDNTATHIFSSATRQRIDEPPAFLIDTLNAALEIR